MFCLRHGVMHGGLSHEHFQRCASCDTIGFFAESGGSFYAYARCPIILKYGGTVVKQCPLCDAITRTGTSDAPDNALVILVKDFLDKVHSAHRSIVLLTAPGEADIDEYIVKRSHEVRAEMKRQYKMFEDDLNKIPSSISFREWKARKGLK